MVTPATQSALMELFNEAGLHDEDFIEVFGKALHDAVMSAPDSPAGPAPADPLDWDGAQRVGTRGLRILNLEHFLIYHAKILTRDQRELLEMTWTRRELCRL